MFQFVIFELFSIIKRLRHICTSVKKNILEFLFYVFREAYIATGQPAVRPEILESSNQYSTVRSGTAKFRIFLIFDLFQ